MRKESRVDIYQSSVLPAMLMVAGAAWLGWIFGQNGAMQLARILQFSLNIDVAGHAAIRHRLI